MSRSATILIMPAVSRIAPRARHKRHGNDIAPATVTLVHRFFLAEADGRYLRVGEDRARDDAVIDAARLIIGKRIVNSDAAVLAADSSADHVAASKNVRHVRAQVFVNADLTFVTQFDSGLFVAIRSEFGRRPAATKSFSARGSV